MDPEEEFRITPGRVFMVPLGPDGKPSEPREWSPLQEVGLTDFKFDWEDDGGHEEGLDGGLQGRPDGALIEEVGKRSWSVSMEFSGEVGIEVRALMVGKTVEEYRDLLQWARESAWLEKVTGLNWARFE